MEKRIFILGAGASIGHSNGIFPNIHTFFTKAIELGLGKEDFFKKIQEYVHFFIGKEVTREPVNIEDVFTHFEIEIERTSNPELINHKYWLTKIISEVLLRLERKLMEANHPKGEYHSFIGHLLPQDTVLSFNWDTVLDNIFGKQYSFSQDASLRIENTDLHYRNFMHYISGVGEATIDRSNIEPPYPLDGKSRKETIEMGYFLKLHGSIDYFVCNNMSCRAYGKLFAVPNPSRQYACRECDEYVDVLIVPPVFNKTIRQYPAIRRIWNLAKRQVEAATEIVIWGYSLPPGDYYSTWLLRQSRFMPISKFTIINKEAARETIEGRQLRDRLLDPLLDKLQEKEIEIYSSFEDYLKAQ